MCMTPSMGAEKSNYRGANRIHVAVADDDDDNRALMAAALRRDGYEVVEARDGAELLACCESLVRARQPPDMIISDISMPGCDGVNATRALLSQCPLLHVILVTGCRDPGIWRDAYASGADVVLAKPVQAQALLAAVEAAFSAKDLPVRFERS